MRTPYLVLKAVKPFCCDINKTLNIKKKKMKSRADEGKDLPLPSPGPWKYVQETPAFHEMWFIKP